MRRAGRELLSLALIDARNRTLRWLSAFNGARVEDLRSEFDPPLWLVGHVAWFQECAIARNLRRAQGAAAATATLASIEPRADAWFDPTLGNREQRWRHTDVADAHLRDYLAATLDATLELLEHAPEDDAGLQLFRLVLAREDWAAEMLAALAQAAGLGGPDAPRAQAPAAPAADPGSQISSTRELWPIWPSRVRREPLWFGAQRVSLGTAHGGFVPDNERWAHDEPVPEFEIDAQPVQWSQYVEFVDDGGYDEPRWWSQAGWGWLERQQRRAPRYVEQTGRAVLAQRAGQLQRVASAQAVAHVSWHEADAWCRWASRRLPTEPEWEIAATSGVSRGFVWGDVHEWMAGRAARWSDEPPMPAPAWVGDTSGSALRSLRVTRGGSLMTVPRLKHPKARTFCSPEHDAAFVGFRSCAL
ncbi:MAG TPA: SUMF1/EgtB/PvdO family nonheme iron enzyme [Burkholderiaceae bacterium]|nr:SUMF1/EgtB/PvdO family nonheme iron enzyme [Burkholderiaceae bacterium]